MSIRPRRIGYIGNFTQAHCTEVHLAATLEDLGCEVVRMQEDALLPQWADELDVDMLLYTRTWGRDVTLDHLRQVAEKGIPSVSYHLDLYVGIQREAGLDNDPFWRTDYVFTPDGDPKSAEVFRKKGINHFFMPPGVYKPECVKGTPRDEFKCDVLFVGGGEGYHTEDWPYRMELINWLRDTYGNRFKKFGNPEPTIRNMDLNDLYASAKVVVGDSLCKGFTHQFYWSDRVYETTGRGGFLIHPEIVGLSESFEPNELVTYKFGDFNDLQQKINYYLENDRERNEIRERGMKRTIKDHTYHNRMAKMLETVC